MWCSASQGMCSSSSSRVISGILIFLTITECPETAVATSRPLKRSRFFSVRMASTTALWFMIAPSTMVWAGNGSMPKLTRWKPLPVSLSWTAFTEFEPTSRPMQYRGMTPLQHLGGSPREMSP